MKRLFPYLAILLIAVSSCKKDKTRHFTITANCPDSVTATLEIDNQNYQFTGPSLGKEVSLGEYDVISASVASGTGAPLSLDLSENGSLLGQAYGTGYVYMIIDNGGMSSTSTTTTSGGGSSSGSNCATVRCSATTQSGSRCKRMTTNCNGRCWQHQ